MLVWFFRRNFKMYCLLKASSSVVQLMTYGCQKSFSINSLLAINPVDVPADTALATVRIRA